jgi:two-component system sensor histidine kinase MprB
MSLRLRIVLSLAVLAAASTTLACATAYWSTESRLYQEVDSSINQVQDLYTRNAERSVTRPDNGGGNPAGTFGGLGGTPTLREIESRSRQLVYATQFLDQSGNVVASPLSEFSTRTLPVDDKDKKIAVDGGSLRRDVSTDTADLRILTISLPGRGAVQIARDLTETHRVLDSLRMRYLALAISVSALAAAIGLWIARRVTRPLVQLTAAVEMVSSTGHFGHEVAGEGNDETGRLAAAFNNMLGALARSREQQQQLVQDAGHELRTPLTSIRTNVSVLKKHERLTSEQMAQTVDDIQSELVELTTLVNEIVELATDARDDEASQLVDLRSIVERSAERVERRAGRRVTVVADGSIVNGRVGALERAIGNLVDNAAKFDDSSLPIEVTVRNSHVVVRDHGPGLAEEDIAHVFDRFYRAAAARSKNGSGLGLAIVRDIVTAHGGTVSAANAPGGGALFTIELPRA